MQTAAKPSVPCCHLANEVEELGGLATVISLFAKLLWSFFDLKMACFGVFCGAKFDILVTMKSCVKITP